MLCARTLLTLRLASLLFPPRPPAGPGKVVALYFSAHWCPPCRRFTPELAAIYKRFKDSHARAADWEVVFVSSDSDEAAFKEYAGEMPWLALPYERRTAKAQLSQLFKVRGIPSLVLVDGHTGELINANGRGAVAADEECADFPWRPRTFEQIMQGAQLVEAPPPAAAGEQDADTAGATDTPSDAAAATPAPTSAPAPCSASERLRGKVTLLYFSASWCPPCRSFTPKLVETYKALVAAGRQVEAVFVSADRSEEAWREYHSHMCWPALPLSDRRRSEQLDA